MNFINIFDRKTEETVEYRQSSTLLFLLFFCPIINRTHRGCVPTAEEIVSHIPIFGFYKKPGNTFTSYSSPFLHQIASVFSISERTRSASLTVGIFSTRISLRPFTSFRLQRSMFFCIHPNTRPKALLP